MDSIFSYIVSLSKHWKTIIISVSILIFFWFLALLMFKPDYINLPIHIQFALVFCLSCVWYSFNYLIAFLMEKIDEKDEDFVPVFSLFTSLFNLCLAIFKSYYNSYTFTKFLQTCFLFGTCGLLGLIILALLSYRNKKQKKDN